MAEGSGGEKTEQPTPKKLRDARKKGQVAKSKEIAGTLGLVIIFAYIFMRSDTIQRDFIELYKVAAMMPTLPFDIALAAMFDAIVKISTTILVPIIGITILAAILGNMVQIGVLFSVQAVKPDLNKLNPAQGIKKIVSAKNFINFGKEIVKVTLLGLIVFFVIREGVGDLMRTGYCGLGCGLAMFGKLMTQVIVYSMGVFIVSALIDYGLERWQYVKGLKMTKDEVKREYKEMEGDPHIKGRRRQLHRELLTNDQVQATKKSNVVVTNPTHLAVALRYDRNDAPLPILVAKGENLIAAQIISVAEDNDVPITQNIDLARALYEQVELNNIIPSDLIEPVAEVLRWVRKIAKERELAGLSS